MSRRTVWSGRFKGKLSEEALSFTSSLELDARLAWYDVVGSIAHAEMLGKQGIISEGEMTVIVEGLKEILREIDEESLELSGDFEDVHSGIEFLLTERIGEAGKKLHTARSRNDQTVTDLRMFLRDAVLDLTTLLIDLEDAIIRISRSNLGTVLPGFTHLQHAQPVTLAHHLLAHLSRLSRDVERFADAYERINVCPLGSAALAGTTYDIDRKFTAKLLGFSSYSVNAMDGVSDRDFAAEFVFNCSLTMIHLSSICEELVIWSTPEFGFVELDDAYSTGSSIMPQKKNPDIAELVRGRASGVIGNLVSVLALGKGLPMSYNRDLQEDKSPVFGALDTTAACLRIIIPVVRTLRFDAERMRARAEEGYMNATDLADYLVTKGVPFREAHEIVGGVVRHAIGSGRRIEEVPLPKLREFSDRFEGDIYDVLSLESSVGRRRSDGGTSPESVKRQIDVLSGKVRAQRDRVKKEERRLQSVWRKLL